MFIPDLDGVAVVAASGVVVAALEVSAAFEGIAGSDALSAISRTLSKAMERSINYLDDEDLALCCLVG